MSGLQRRWVGVVAGGGCVRVCGGGMQGLVTIVHTLAERVPDAETGAPQLPSADTTSLTVYHNFWKDQPPTAASEVRSHASERARPYPSLFS